MRSYGLDCGLVCGFSSPLKVGPIDSCFDQQSAAEDGATYDQRASMSCTRLRCVHELKPVAKLLSSKRTSNSGMINALAACEPCWREIRRWLWIKSLSM